MEINRDEFLKLYEAIKPHLINDPKYRAMERQEDRMAYIKRLIDGARNEAAAQNLR